MSLQAQRHNLFLVMVIASLARNLFNVGDNIMRLLQ